jgi:hypothetical protein
MEYCIKCWSDKVTKEINSTLFKPFMYCNWCNSLFEYTIKEIQEEDFLEYSDSNRMNSVIMLGKFNYHKSKLSISDLEKLWIM